jgi:ACS family hexuronate transporter-like MFS transporter
MSEKSLQEVSKNWPWIVCWLMFGATALNYMDRQSLALVQEPIKTEFKLNNEDFGWVMAAFQITYALAQIPAGFMADRMNVRLLYMVAVGWWSLAAMACGFAPSVLMLILMRILLGMGESFNWPCALQVTSRILPPAERALGNGIFNSGAAVGAVVTPLLVPPLTLYFGWRVAFFSLGVLGLAWIIVWRAIIRPEFNSLFDSKREQNESDMPAASMVYLIVPIGLAILSWVMLAERFGKFRWWVAATVFFAALLLQAVVYQANGANRRTSWYDSLTQVVRMKRFWILVVVSVSVNVCWHFLVNWMPGYLSQDRGMSFLKSGLFVALPFLAADGGNLLGGWLSREVARNYQLTAARARWLVMVGCAAMVSSGALLGLVSSNVLAIILLAVMAMGTAGFMANYFAFCQEVSSRHTGLIVGLLGGLGNLFAGGFLPYAGQVKDVTGSFAPIFVIVGVLPLVGLGALGLFWGFSEPMAEGE